MNDDLVKRLRERPNRRGHESNDEANERRQKERDEAADRIEALWEVLQETTNKWRDAADRIEQLEAALRESYKFEETLMRISHLADQHPVFDDALKAYTRCSSIARAALGEKKDG
jgi:predicted patatin/cPLA2 family phospholipase